MAFSRLGWSLKSAASASLAVGLTNEDVPPAPTVPPKQIIAYTSIDIIDLFLTKGTETLEVEIAKVADDPLAQVWVLSIMEQGRPQPCPLGTGFPGGPCAVIYTGTRLIRGTWWDGQPLDTDPNQIDARMELCLERAGEIVARLGT